MLPGVMAPAVGGNELVIATNQVDYDFFAAIGSPSTPQLWTVRILPGVELSASDRSLFAWTDVGLNALSTIVVILEAGAEIKGAGGDGGNGGQTFTGDYIAQGGGGGGAGAVPGNGGGGAYQVGGIGISGLAGTELAGGAGAFSSAGLFGTLIHQGTIPEDGGDAMYVSAPYILFNAGEIRGGGGGGCPSNDLTIGGGENPATPGGVPGAGGLLGIDPRDGVSPYQSAGGNAIRRKDTNATVTFQVGGSAPNVQGAVST